MNLLWNLAKNSFTGLNKFFQIKNFVEHQFFLQVLYGYFLLFPTVQEQSPSFAQLWFFKNRKNPWQIIGHFNFLLQLSSYEGLTTCKYNCRNKVGKCYICLYFFFLSKKFQHETTQQCSCQFEFLFILNK